MGMEGSIAGCGSPVDLTLRVNVFNSGAPRLGIAAPAGETIAT